jgi:tRNA A37 threonylcarbamoyladenosine dehydratase
LAEPDADLQRRFGGLARLYGAAGAQAIARAHVVVVGIGGVGSWAVEALARSGVAALTLIDLDHIAESNVNRQVHALSSTLGQAKVQAMRERIEQIHPACQVHCIEDFVSPDNWPALAGLEAGRDRPLAVIRPSCRWPPGLCRGGVLLSVWAQPVASVRRIGSIWPIWPR